MNRGFGRVYRPTYKNHKTGERTIASTWSIAYYFRGEQRRESSGSKNRIDAMKLLRRRLDEIAGGRLFAADAERITFQDLAKMVTEDYQINGRKSLKRAERALKSLSVFFGFYRAMDITTDRITAYIKQRQRDGLAAATIRYELSILKRAFSLALRSEKLQRKPYIPSIAVSNVRKEFFVESEFRALLPHLSDSIRPVIEFLWLTGWRKSEALGLEWKQIDWSSKTVRLDPGTTKNDEGRIFPFGVYPDLERLLTARKEITDALQHSTAQFVPWVFHRNGQPIREFSGAWKTACKKAGLHGRWCHDLRRSAVRRMEQRGVPRTFATKLIGHKTESIYRRYAIVSVADLSEGVARLAGKPATTEDAKTVTVVPIDQSLRSTAPGATRATKLALASSTNPA